MTRSKKRSRNWSLFVVLFSSICISLYLFKFITMWQVMDNMHKLFHPIVTVFWVTQFVSHYQKYKKLTAEIKQ